MAQAKKKSTSKTKKNTTKKNNISRQERYEYWTSEMGLGIIQGLLLDGNDLSKIYTNYIKVSKNTFYEWCKKNKELNRIKSQTVESCDAMVRNSLLKSATGFTQEVECITMNGIEKIERYFPPDPKAMKIYLERRDRLKERLDKQANKPQVNVSINIDGMQADAILDLDKDISHEGEPKDD